jgi:hypothetical protein
MISYVLLPQGERQTPQAHPISRPEGLPIWYLVFWDNGFMGLWVPWAHGPGPGPRPQFYVWRTTYTNEVKTKDLRAFGPNLGPEFRLGSYCGCHFSYRSEIKMIPAHGHQTKFGWILAFHYLGLPGATADKRKSWQSTTCGYPGLLGATADNGKSWQSTTWGYLGLLGGTWGYL